MIAIILAAASGLISATGGTIAATVGAIGGSLTAFSTSVAGIIATALEALSPLRNVLSFFANNLLQSLDILKLGETVELFGEKALQAAKVENGKTLADFENCEKYMDYLRSFEIDQKKADERNPIERLVASLGVGTAAVESKFAIEYGSLSGLWLLPMLNADYFTPDRVKAWLDSGMSGGNIFAYLRNEMSGADASQLRKSFEINQDGTPMNANQKDQLYSELGATKEQWQKLSNQLTQFNQ